MQKIVTNLWFDTEAEEAAEFYTSLFEDGRIVSTTHYTDAVPDKSGTVLTVEFELQGQRFVGINGGPLFEFSEAISLQVNCEDQDEIDYFWEKLTEGGAESECGWLKDRYGLSWQIVPEDVQEIFSDRDPAAAERAMNAMFKMRKLDIDALRRAAKGTESPGGR